MTMKRPAHVRAVAKWTTTVLLGAACTVFSLSWARTVAYQGSGWGLLLDEGVVTAHWGFGDAGRSRSYGWAIRPVGTRLGFRLLWIESLAWPDGRRIVYVPLWIVIAGLAAASVGAWYWARPKWPAGQCSGCGYDLRGNTLGRCPECGRPVPVRDRAMLIDAGQNES